jgi:hypothetical protein
VHALLSVQGAVLGTPHVPVPLQTLWVQGLPSSEQDVPDWAKHVSVVSLQTLAHSPPPEHGLPDEVHPTRGLQTSVPSQKKPFSHCSFFGAFTHSPATHESVVHAMPSSQFNGVPRQVPFEQ